MTAGKSAVEIALFILLPIMAISLSIMRLLEAAGVLDWVVARLVPILRPFGLTGLSVFALLQVNLVSFAAPIATLSIMDKRGTSDRHLAATFAMVIAMGQANVAFPLTSLGLHLGIFILVSLVGGLVAAFCTFYLLGRNLMAVELKMEEHLPHTSLSEPKGILAIINHAGAEAFRIAVGTIPILALALLFVALAKLVGGFALLEILLAPILHLLHIDPVLVIPTLTKWLGGATGVMGLLVDMQRNGVVDSQFLNKTGGWLINTLDVPGIAILMSSGPRISKVWKQAVLGGFVGILVRTLIHAYVL
ncbi:nucleoside recognition family protein [Noviherbaspirillum denitrificans]|nr:nucleoside recognition family protein [Noviherbaspirillum denitrificans]